MALRIGNSKAASDLGQGPGSGPRTHSALPHDAGFLVGAGLAADQGGFSLRGWAQERWIPPDDQANLRGERQPEGAPLHPRSQEFLLASLNLGNCKKVMVKFPVLALMSIANV